MAELEDNVVLRLLREIHLDSQDSHQRLIRLEGRLEEMLVDTKQAMSAVGSESKTATTNQIAALKRRVQELEARK